MKRAYYIAERTKSSIEHYEIVGENESKLLSWSCEPKASSDVAAASYNDVMNVRAAITGRRGE